MNLTLGENSRIRFLSVVVVAVIVLFAIRLFYIQIVRHDYYVSQADREQIKQFVLHAKRGEIYTYDGGTPEPLVLNETVFTVWVDPQQIKDRAAVTQAVNEIAGGNARKNFTQYMDMKKSRYQVIATKVSRKQAEMLKEKNLAGVGFDAVTQRVYPEGQLASQLLGFVNAEGEGKYGFEQANNEALKGRDGILKTVTDVRSVPLTIGAKNINTPAVDGKNFVLSIDRYIQARVEKALADGIARSGATHASAVVMDPSSGKVLSMANVPTYDPGQLASVTDAALFNNNVISRPYEPGSDIKTFTIATGLDKGVIAPDSTYSNTDSVQVGDITISNATKGKTGQITMQTALNWSLNTGMVHVARQLGGGGTINRQARDTMYEYFHDRFRMGEVTGIELANEARGTLIAPTEAEGNAVRYSNMAFGQGMDATMIQVASGFCSIINGGTYYAPSVISGTIDAEGKFAAQNARESHENIVSEATSRQLRDMINEAHYATYKPASTPEGYLIGGKTGTSQTIQNGKYVNDTTIGTYLGFGGETGKIPRYVIMVEISADDRSMGGGTDAKPIFNDISDWMIQYFKLQPNQ